MLCFRRFSSFGETALTILQKFTNFDESKYSPDVQMGNFGLDSLDAVEFVITLERELKIELTDEEALPITTVNQAFSVFSKYKNLS